MEGLVSSRDMFLALGFEEVWDCISECLPGYRFRFDGFDLSATQLMGFDLQPIFHVGGNWYDGRSIALVLFEMPLMVESIDQGAAWIADGLDRHRVKPLHPPVWLVEGRGHKHLLPRIRELRAYEARPMCLVDVDWLRLAARKLRVVVESAGAGQSAILSFDGAILRIATGSEVLAMAGIGGAWPEPVEVELGGLTWAVGRLPGRTITVSLWEGRLSVGGRVVPLLNR